MPFYEYLCKNCGHILEELQTMSEPELVTCPVCNHDTLKKMIGSGSGLIFKGSGFYLTDYKKKSSSETKEPDTTSSGKETSTGKDTSTSKDATTSKDTTSKSKDTAATTSKDTSSKSKDSTSSKTDSKTDKKKNK